MPALKGEITPMEMTFHRKYFPNMELELQFRDSKLAELYLEDFLPFVEESGVSTALVIFRHQFLVFLVDLRRQSCYLGASGNLCSLPMRQAIRRDQCCCSVGLAWGHECEACPHKESGKLMFCLYYSPVGYNY